MVINAVGISSINPIVAESRTDKIYYEIHLNRSKESENSTSLLAPLAMVYYSK